MELKINTDKMEQEIQLLENLKIQMKDFENYANAVQSLFEVKMQQNKNC